MADEVTSFSQDISVEEIDPILDKFLIWCKENGLILSKKVKVCSRGSCHRYGMVATDDISQGECLFSIPRNLLLEPKTCSVSDVVQALETEKLEKSQRGSGWIPLLLALMYEYTNPTSFWRPYLDIIPGIDVLDQPIFWTKNDRERLLKGTEIEEDVEQDLKCIEKEYSSVVKAFIKNNKNKFDKTTHSLALYKHMAAFIMAYSFTENNPGCQGDNAPVMVPMADILNHHSNNNAHLEFAKEELRMVSTQPIAKDQEVFNTYGQLANCHLLQSYGFVEKTPNPNDTMDIPVAIVYDVLRQHSVSKHEARIFDAKFQLMEEMGLASSDDVFVFDLKGYQNHGPDLSVFLKVLHLSEEELKLIFKKDQETENHPKDLEDLVRLFENCSEEQKSINSKIIENVFNVKDRKRRNESLVDNESMSGVANKKAKARRGGCRNDDDDVVDDEEDDDDDNDDYDDYDDNDDNDDEPGHYAVNGVHDGDDDDNENDVDDDSNDDLDASNDDDDDEVEDDDDDDDIDSEHDESKSEDGDDEKIDHVTYEQMKKEFPLAWRQALSRVAKDCSSRIVTMEKEKEISTENTDELTTREQSIKLMLGGLKDILRHVCELVHKQDNEESS